MKRIGGLVLLLILGLFQVTPVLARSDDLIQRKIEAQIAESEKLRGTRIEVHVEQRLVVLTGYVRLYEQRLIADRIDWTTLGVFEVDNKIRGVPKLPLFGSTTMHLMRKCFCPAWAIKPTSGYFVDAGLRSQVAQWLEGSVGVRYTDIESVDNFSLIANALFEINPALGINVEADIGDEVSTYLLGLRYSL